MIEFSAIKALQTSDGILNLDVSLQVKKGEILCLYGNSGVGKTTLLKILAGLTPANASKISVGEEVWDDSVRKIHLAPQKRSIGFVFQEYALFPNMTVKENLEYALPKGESTSVLNDLLDLMDLQPFYKSKIHHLSGGQKQRIALARAIVRKPKILLLDEPLSALDAEMRIKLQNYILQVHQQFDLTTIFVSHHLPEVFKLSSKVVVLDRGKISREGSAAEVFSNKPQESAFSMVGEILDLQYSSGVWNVKILVGTEIISLPVSELEKKELHVGDRLMISSNVFQPSIHKIMNTGS